MALVFPPHTSIYAGHEPDKDLQGPSFTDPSDMMTMSDMWVGKYITYDIQHRGADIVVSLDQQFYPFFLPVIKKYAKEKDLKIIVTGGTCGISSGMLSRKAADIGGFCCAAGFIDRLPGVKFHTIGIASLALIVHPKNRVDNISLAQAQDIFAGDISRWSLLKSSISGRGANIPIQPFARLHCKLRPGHWRRLLDREDLFSHTLQEVGAIPDMISQVAANPAAIGYETMVMIRRYSNNGGVNVLKIDGYDPDDSADLISGKYPLYRVYNLTTWEGDTVENPVAQKLVKYLMDEVERSSSRFGIVPVSMLKKAGWKFNKEELVAEPGG